MTEAEARALCSRFGAQGTVERLEHFLGLLADENTRQNLVSSASMAQVWTRHFADSLQLLAHVPRETAGPWLDLGTGAGFPGLAVALAQPERSVVMVESRRRRAEFLSRVADQLGLRHCTVKACRVEAVPPFPAAVISARAFAPLPKLLELSAAFSTPATLWLLPKGRSAAQERDDLPHPLKAMFHVEQSLTDAEARILVGRGKVGAA